MTITSQNGSGKQNASCICAIIFECDGDVVKFRPGTPSKEALQHLRLRWGDGWAVDHDDFELTPSSPPLHPGVYDYKQHPLTTAKSVRTSSVQTRHERDAELLRKAKADFKTSWQQLWSCFPNVKYHDANLRHRSLSCAAETNR